MGGTGGVVAVGLAVALGLATVHCLVRCVVPRWRSEHASAVDGWHVLMGVAMIAMLLAPVGSGAATVQAMVFGIGALWCACHLVARHRAFAHARLGAACLVMTGMLMPAVVVAPASAAEVEAEWMSGHVGHAGMTDMAGSSMSGHPGHSGHGAMAMPPTWLAVSMLVVLGVLAVASVAAAVRPAQRRTSVRWGVAGELVMAGAMGYMVAMAA